MREPARRWRAKMRDGAESAERGVAEKRRAMREEERGGSARRVKERGCRGEDELVKDGVE
jgi:hypothetical protein